MGGNTKLWTGKTVRSEAIFMAKCAIWRAAKKEGRKINGYDALLSVADGWRSRNEGTIIHSCGRYLSELSDAAYRRLASEIEKASV